MNFHLFNISTLEVVCLFLLKLLGVRIVITCHDVTPFTSEKTTSALMKKVLNLARSIVVHAEHNKLEMVKRYNIENSKIHVIPLPAWPVPSETLPDVSEARRRIGADKFKRIVLFFGNIRREKGLDVLIRAMKKVIETFPDTCLVIAGRMFKHSFDIYQNIAEKLNLRDNVIKRIEYIPDDEMAYYYTAADVVAVPYLQISQSAVLLTAYSYAKPVVATRVGGMPEIIIEGETGYLVEPQNPDDLADKIILILSDLDRASKMGQKAKQYAEENFSIQSVSRKLFELLG